MSLSLKVVFTSDWHIGSGASGVEGIDRGVVRDNHGFPYIPAKSMTGVLRDSLEDLTSALGPGWDEWVTFLMGTQPALDLDTATSAPVPATVSVRPLHLSDRLRARLDSDEARLRCTFVKAGVSIDRYTGSARKGLLNFAEMARPAVLHGRIDIDVEGPARDTAVALVAAACAYTESIGGGRRKGSGRCTVTLLDDGRPVVIDDYASALPETAPRPPAHRTDTVSGSAWGDDGSAMSAIDLRLTTVTPLLVAARATGNVVEGLDSVPGSALVPHLHRWLQHAGADATGLIAHGRVAVLRAVPMIGGDRSLPASFALRRPKDRSDESWSNATGPTGADGGASTKQVRSGWLAGSTTPFSYASTVPTVASTHNVVDDDLQTPTTRTGGLFTYVAVAAGVRLHLRLLVPASLRAAVLEAVHATGDTIRVGRSKKDDYGLVRVEPVSSAQPVTPQPATDGVVRVWAASDVIPVDGVTPQAWADTVALAAGVDPADIEVDAPATRVRHSRIDAWHAAWGFPRPTLSAIAAGSCLALRTVSPEAATAVRRLSGGVIGLRTAEGMGETVVDHPLLGSAEVVVRGVAVDRDGGPATAGPLDVDDEVLASAVARSVLEHRIREAALARSSSITWPRSNSQFGRLRGWVQSAETPFDADRLRQFDHDAASWPAGARAEVRSLLSDPAQVWKSIGLAADRRLDHNGDDLGSAMWGGAVRAVVEAAHRTRTRGAG